MIEELAGAVQSIGFSCQHCGSCCSGDDFLVILTPAEVRAIRTASGTDPAAPYPGFIEGPDGSRFTLAWCLRAENGKCPFLEGNRCRIYEARPWICRTYPFWLDGDRLRVDDCCPGVGHSMTEAKSTELARALLARRASEEAEEEGVKRNLSRVKIPAGASVCIDSEGCWILDE
ncbi:MAG: YkgJ family cysteine cluster protein [Methanoculleaceae archaeon]